MRVSSRSGASRTGRQVSNNALICIADRGVFCWYERRGYTRASTPIHEATIRRLPVPAASVHRGGPISFRVAKDWVQRPGRTGREDATKCKDLPGAGRHVLASEWCHVEERPHGPISSMPGDPKSSRSRAPVQGSDWCRRSGSGAGSRAKDDTIRHIVLTTAPPPSASGDAVVPHQGPGSFNALPAVPRPVSWRSE